MELLSDMFSDPADPVEQAADPTPEQPQAEAADLGDSEAAEPATESDEPQQAAATVDPERQKQIDQLVKDFGLDLQSERDRKILDRMLMADKRKADADDYIGQLKTQLLTSEYLTDYEKKLYSPQSETAAPQPVPATRVPEQGVPSMRFGDGYDHWQSPEDAVKDLNKAYAEGDARAVANIDAAVFTRRAQAIVMPQVQALVYRALQDLKGTDLAPVLQSHEQRTADEADTRARVTALAELRKDPNWAKALDEMFVTEGEIEFDGKKYPSNAMRRIVKENPEILDINREDPVLTWIARTKAAVRHYIRQSESGLNMKKASQIFKAGGQRAKEDIAQNRVRQQVNAGSSKGSGRPLSADDQFIADLSKTGGVLSGQSASSLFRK